MKKKTQSLILFFLIAVALLSLLYNQELSTHSVGGKVAKSALWQDSKDLLLILDQINITLHGIQSPEQSEKCQNQILILCMDYYWKQAGLSYYISENIKPSNDPNLCRDFQKSKAEFGRQKTRLEGLNYFNNLDLKSSMEVLYASLFNSYPKIFE